MQYIDPPYHKHYINLFMYVFIYFVFLSYGHKFALNIWQSSNCKNFGECKTESIKKYPGT